MSSNPSAGTVERQRVDVDVVCVGFGPAMAGFLTTLSKKMVSEDGSPVVESTVMPGMPPQVVCYERADDIGFGVSGVVTQGRGLRESFPGLQASSIPLAADVTEEKVIYLLDPHGASRRSLPLRGADAAIRAFGGLLPFKNDSLELPWTPDFLHKKGGFVFSLGQLMQWVGAQVQGTGTVQIWPGTPVAGAIIEADGVIGVRLLDQGVEKGGAAAEGFMPGMDIHAALTVVGDGPVGGVGMQLDDHFGLPEGHHLRDWALGMKFVVDLPETSDLKPGLVLHTLGYPEPEIFGFLYVHPDRVASLGIFVPSWFDNPARTAYRYLQHWMMHPRIWPLVNGGRIRSWGAKSLGESGARGEPHLVGNGYARIGEGSGSTNVLTGSGVDEAWTTGTQLAESVLEILKSKEGFTRENLSRTYVRRRRESWVEREGRVAEKSRDGFQRGVVTGLIGMALAGLTQGRFTLGTIPRRPYERLTSLEEYYEGRITPVELDQLRRRCTEKGSSLQDALMDRCGWPSIPMDGQLLISQQDALLLGGKVQAPPGYADHVVFQKPGICGQCGEKVCIEMCSGQAIQPGNGGVPSFDREKCVHCGACYWNCSRPDPSNPERMMVSFRPGTGGLHSAEN
ncbi:MAG: 4Fe-4S ferredoxin [Verrucomicrobia bacterium]|nr:4Fe-4S ferredoxin [Verrucomicrobiota bacterium]